MAAPRFSSRILVASLLAAVGIVVVGWLDFRATRAELLTLLRDQAAALRQTVAAAARSNQAAGAQAESQVAERLLDNARLLAELDRRGALTQAVLDDIVRRNHLFRVNIFGADGSRTLASAAPGLSGAGRGFQGGGLVPRLLSGGETEAIGGLHDSPGARGGARISAGVRRAAGGAIIVNVDASDVASLQRQASLDTLLAEIAGSAGEIAYLVVERDGQRLEHGSPAPAWAEARSSAAGEVTEREGTSDGRPVIEFAGPVTPGDPAGGTLRLGLRLDGLRRAEGRVLWQLVASLAAALALTVLAMGTIWLRQEYGALSRRHALAQEALRRRDRLSAMGELASTVAHEVRNPLNAIGMSLQRLRREFTDATTCAAEEDRQELQQLLAVVETETARINRIVQQFLEYARPPRLDRREADLGGVVGGVVEALRSLAATRDVAIEADTATAAVAEIDTDQVRQALDNMVRNAVEATPPGGRVKVTASTGSRGHAIEVRDTGAGIPSDALPRIFDLYFTTKAEGTGVGLAVTQQIVSAHGGTIEVDSEPGQGTTMTIRLPLKVEEVAGV